MARPRLFRGVSGVPFRKRRSEGRTACEGGAASACNGFAAKLQKGEFVLLDVKRAAGMFEQGCTGGVPASCSSLGVMFQTGDGVLAVRRLRTMDVP